MHAHNAGISPSTKLYSKKMGESFSSMMHAIPHTAFSIDTLA